MNRRVLAVEVLDEMRILVREPTSVFFLLVMPAGFFALFVAMWGSDDLGGLTAGTSMLATFGTFGVVGVMLLHPGIGVAEDRERGWLRAKRVMAVPAWGALAGKVIACLPIAVVVLATMVGVAALSGTLEVGVWKLLRLAIVLVLGATPFALVGLSVGLLASTQTTTAVLNAIYIPTAVASGLWMPLETLPEVIQQIAPLLPTYHLAQLGLAQLDGATGVGNLAALALWSGATAVLAVIAYGRSRP